jgi:alkylhydroperoxidase family enzyme
VTRPRLAPLAYDDLDDETKALVGAPPVLNIFGTLARHPKLLKRWLVFGAHVLSKSTLPERDRELLVLRTGWNCRAPYEWGQHVAIARRAQITDAEIEAVAVGSDAPLWSRFDATLLRAADQLHADACIDDATWAALRERYDEQQVLDLIFTVGQYHLVSMALNSLGVERDDGVDGVPMPRRE